MMGNHREHHHGSHDGEHLHGQHPSDWVGAWSEKRSQLSPEAVGLVDATTGERFTYADLDERANRAARLLSEYGVADGERVAVVSRNRPALVDLFFASAKIGGVLAPLSHRLAAAEVVEVLNEVEPSLLVVETPFGGLLRDVLEHDQRAFDCPVLSLATDADTGPNGAKDDDTEQLTDTDTEWETYAAALPADGTPVETAPCSMDDPHLLLHTGGSTGIPKETVITHGTLVWNSFNTLTAWGLRPEDVTPMVFPMFHTGGWNVITVPLFHLGGTVVVAREFDPGDVLHQVDSESATVLVAVPAVLRVMCRHETWETTDLSTLRFAKSGGGPCRESVMRSWWDRGVDLSQGYGLTEIGPNNFAMPDGWPREKADSVGVPVMHADARVVNDVGDPVESGQIGELELAGPHAADRYWRNETETEATFGGGWVSTGDLARMDEEGYVYVEGRKKNMYVSGGENVYPAEVEDAVADHPAVEEVVVIGVADETWGQVGKAVVQGDESLTLDDIESFLDGQLARFKHPKRLDFLGEIPTSGPSKIDREAVRAEFGETE